MRYMRSANSVAGARKLPACNRRRLANGNIISAGSRNGQASCLRSPELGAEATTIEGEDHVQGIERIPSSDCRNGGRKLFRRHFLVLGDNANDPLRDSFFTHARVHKRFGAYFEFEFCRSDNGAIRQL
jgi:hypothetical protein